MIGAPILSGGERDLPSLLISYTITYLVSNGYIEQKGMLKEGGWRITLMDKGWAALKKPTLENPGETLGDKVKKWITELTITGAKEAAKKAASGLMDHVLTNASSSWVHSAPDMGSTWT